MCLRINGPTISQVNLPLPQPKGGNVIEECKRLTKKCLEIKMRSVSY